MASGDVQAVIDYFNAALNTIDYRQYPIVDEASCCVYLQVLLIGAALIPRVEVHHELGRSDMEVEVNNRHWVFEFKFARRTDEAAGLLDDAIKQILSRRYGLSTPQTDLIRLIVSRGVLRGGEACSKMPRTIMTEPNSEK